MLTPDLLNFPPFLHGHRSSSIPCSTKKSVPISMLIMSRAFTLQAPDPARALAQSISAMDDDVVTEVSRDCN